ncbi:SRPBCC family protein [Deminuibacter soli]|uniref:Polyketide cyclase n=1 Tax=Deminuibacter soli TaxID=2291815 RepID=A0A3E1NCU2_9BACT|nr:SRPBCC family protein [Deminuibacter soli]RFM25661.1 polyketide cyclase [Deminuibacter soli]
MIILYIIAAVIVLVLIIAAFTGTAWSYEKSIVIQAPVSTVWTHVNSLAALNEWSPWAGKDPAMKKEFSGTDGTPGASFAWDSQQKNVGAGSQTIVKVVNESALDTRIDFLRPFKGVADATVAIAPETGGTRATWKIKSSTPYPMNIIKVFGVIEKNMDRDFNAGLTKLKALSEG